jgi:hypothetical protein
MFENNIRALNPGWAGAGRPAEEFAAAAKSEINWKRMVSKSRPTQPLNLMQAPPISSA